MRRKLKLAVESLEVETFEVSAARDERGTVFGLHVSTAVTCSMSVDVMCDAPSDTVTMDVYAGACNTLECPDDGSLSQYGCNTKWLC
ncbi:MAG TPA: hypothetical protein VHG35_04385 [Gemmatimonadales bacterium]|nr:hypothetical protein [Gemmatimonadales bacterium]